MKCPVCNSGRYKESWKKGILQESYCPRCGYGVQFQPAG